MMVRRSGTRFTLMAAGYKGSGKSSFFNTLIDRQVVSLKPLAGINIYMLNIDCEGLVQKIVFIDTPGFGATMDDSELQDNIVHFIKTQFDLVITEEAKIRRNAKYEDTRVHCLLYFISSTAGELKNTDIVFLKKVCGLVNIIPVISKADGLSVDEVKEMKKKVNEQLKHHKINVFDLENSEMQMFIPNAIKLNSYVPLTVISSDEDKPESRDRKCEWGTAYIDNPEHCDVSILKEILLSAHMHGLMDTTSTEIYENYRSSVLESIVPSQK